MLKNKINKWRYERYIDRLCLSGLRRYANQVHLEIALVLVLTIFNEGAYLTLNSIFHNALTFKIEHTAMEFYTASVTRVELYLVL